MSKQLTLGSLFDGIGGWQIAAVHNGVKPIWSCEIEQFPMAVTKKWFPDTEQLGDITKLDGAKIPPVDIICSGSPCQSFSVAGTRKGFEGQSGIFFDFVRVVKEMLDATNRQYPHWVVWENVPGVYSSGKRNDIKEVFKCFDDLGFVLDVNILDAQHMGVPQRRKRVFAVWENVDYIRQMRTNTSFSIITQCLVELLVCILNEQLNLYGTGPKDSVWKTKKLAEGGLQKKMRLFKITEKEQFVKLLKSWEETSQKLIAGQKNLGLQQGQKEEQPDEDMTRYQLTQTQVSELFGNIDGLWNKLLADLFKKGKLFTTLTATSEITESTICTCANLLESIDSLIVQLTGLWQNFYETELYISTMRKELIRYANEGSADITLFGRAGDIYAWNDYLHMVSNKRIVPLADFAATRRGAGEVLLEQQSLPGHSSQGRGKRESSAGETDGGSHTTS